MQQLAANTVGCVTNLYNTKVNPLFDSARVLLNSHPEVDRVVLIFNHAAKAFATAAMIRYTPGHLAAKLGIAAACNFIYQETIENRGCKLTLALASIWGGIGLELTRQGLAHCTTQHNHLKLLGGMVLSMSYAWYIIQRSPQDVVNIKKTACNKAE